jgi:hypothetical protein
VSADPSAWRAIGTLYNALVTAMVVSLVTRRGAEVAREYVFRHFRRQHLDKFLPGLAKLGLTGHPPAVACALYHYHSNALGGVRTEYFRESDRKAWVRYPPPRWMWRGTAIAAIPSQVSAAMLHGWHGHNGVSLGNPRLGFVCTGMTVDGMPGLEGYYLEHERELRPDERVRFAYGGETMPRFDPGAAPVLETQTWPAERLERTRRRYAMDYVRTMLAVLEELLGPAEAGAELARVAKLVGLQFCEEAGLDAGADGGQAFARWLVDMLRAQGEDASLEAPSPEASGPALVVVALPDWKLARGLPLRDPAAAFAGWAQLWAGACAAHDRFLLVETTTATADGGLSARWRISPRG